MAMEELTYARFNFNRRRISEAEAVLRSKGLDPETVDEKAFNGVFPPQQRESDQHGASSTEPPDRTPSRKSMAQKRRWAIKRAQQQK